MQLIALHRHYFRLAHLVHFLHLREEHTKMLAHVILAELPRLTGAVTPTIATRQPDLVLHILPACGLNFS